MDLEASLGLGPPGEATHVKLFGNLAWGVAWGALLVSWVGLYWINHRLIKLIREQQKFYMDVFEAFNRYRSESVDDFPGP